MQTSVHYTATIKAFTRWLAMNKRIPHDPIAYMKRKPKGDMEPTFKRRPFSSDELNRLLANARKGKSIISLTGKERMFLYLTASGTGFRAHELSTITPASCFLEGPAPYIEIACTISKRRKTDRQEISVGDTTPTVRGWKTARYSPLGRVVVVQHEPGARDRHEGNQSDDGGRDPDLP